MIILLKMTFSLVYLILPLFFIASFDQDIFVDYVCNTTDPQAAFLGCLSANCVDDNKPVTDSVEAGASKTYSFTVQNPNACYSVALLVKYATLIHG